jgi:lysylphosphatidylglycerol synthetase-like protein (DUF2156 family)
MTQTPPPPGYPPGAYPGHQPPPAQGGSVGLAIASMICGIISLICFCAWYISMPLAIIAIILGVIAKNQAERGQAGGRGMALAGLICGSIGVLLAIIMLIIFFTAGPALQNKLMIWQKNQMQQMQQRQGTSTTAPSTEP